MRLSPRDCVRLNHWLPATRPLFMQYCRAIFEAAPEDFQLAVAALQDRHGRPCQRRYVLCALWMVRLGTGLLPAKDIANAARRVGVS